MNELRRDYILDRWVIIAEERKKRPQDFIRASKKEKPKMCYFCPGNEHLTPPEIDRIEENGRWIVRCFPNKFPAVILDDSEIKSENEILRRIPAYGKHEVIAETPEHNKNLSDLSVEHIVKIFLMYARRINEIKKDKKIKYVFVFKNHGEMGGASIAHSHTQIIGLPIIPKIIMDEINSADEYKSKTGRCIFCDVLNLESKSERRIYEDKYTIAFAPFASRFNLEVWIMPKRHLNFIDEMTNRELKSFANSLKIILGRLNKSLNDPPFNFYLHYPPDGYDLHLHLEIAPRLSRFAGLEFGSGVVINVIPPEVAAAHYRNETECNLI